MKKVKALVLAFCVAALCAPVFAQENLIADPSFESGELGKWKYKGPKPVKNSIDSGMENNENNAKTGTWTYKYWAADGLESTLSQTLSVENGTYRLSVWAMGGGKDNEIRLFAKDHDKSKKQLTANIENKGWKKWEQYTVDVPVSTGKITVGIYVDAAPGCWGNFDDIELVKVE